MTATFSYGQLFARTMQLLRASPLGPALAFLMITATGTASDMTAAGDSAVGMTVLVSVAVMVFQYVLTRAALGELVETVARRGRFASYFALTFVSEIAIAFGLILLVVPGVVLAVRWWIATPLLLDSELTVFESLRESWRRTRGSFWPIFGMVGPAYALALLVRLAVDWAVISSGAEAYSVAQAVPANILFTGAQIFGWYVAVAAYSLTTRAAALSDVFE